jgi:hypothetical protein
MQPPPPNDSLGTHFSICKLTAEPGKDGFWCFPETSCRVSDDIGVPLKRLLLLSERNISSFVPRLSVNKGMLPVRLKLTGTDDLPGSAAVQVGYQYSSLVRGVVAWLAQHARLSCTVGYLSRQVPG